ncbi:MAG: methyltransferase family protein [Gemmatimonadales bacterium]|jgi:protein-S-isoprenylcysteine O-methyltransferase Ste14
MKPLLFVWPYWLVFWAVFLWAFTPESRIIRSAQTPAAKPDSPDAGSVQVIVFGMGVATLVAFAIAWVPSLRWPPAWQPAVFGIGVATLIAGSLLRRHCWRLLGASFTGDVRADAGQRVVTTGAYAFVRHPSYTAGILMNIGLGVALGSWASVLLLAVASFVVYGYRIRVEERALVTAIGEPYREFMRTRRRLIPFVY